MVTENPHGLSDCTSSTLLIFCSGLIHQCVCCSRGVLGIMLHVFFIVWSMFLQGHGSTSLDITCKKLFKKLKFFPSGSIFQIFPGTGVVSSAVVCIYLTFSVFFCFVLFSRLICEL